MTSDFLAIQGRLCKGQRGWDFGFSDSDGALCPILNKLSWISDKQGALAVGGKVFVDFELMLQIV
jgi:hypothetical protein